MNPSTRQRTLLGFFGRLALFLVPLLLLPLFEVVALRHGVFTFRVWEALLVTTARALPDGDRLLRGPFYPDQHVEMAESGDLGHHSRWATKTTSRWETDRYGYRSADFDGPGPEIVVVGDSLAVGSSLDQPETLASVLAARSGLRIATVAPWDLNEYARHERFRLEPPKLLILECAERLLVNLATCEEQTVLVPRIGRRPWRDRLRLAYLTLRDEHDKDPARAWMDARQKGSTVPAHVATDGRMLFLDGPGALAPSPPELVDGVVAKVSHCRDVLAASGTRLLFVIVPNKETVYFDLVPGPKVDFVSTVIERVRAANVRAVDLESAFLESRARDDKLLYQLDDTHWNAAGVAVAADAIAKELAW